MILMVMPCLAASFLTCSMISAWMPGVTPTVISFLSEEADLELLSLLPQPAAKTHSVARAASVTAFLMNDFMIQTLLLFFILLAGCKVAASLNQVDADDEDDDRSQHDIGLETLVAVADGEVA